MKAKRQFITTAQTIILCDYLKNQEQNHDTWNDCNDMYPEIEIGFTFQKIKYLWWRPSAVKHV